MIVLFLDMEKLRVLGFFENWHNVSIDDDEFVDEKSEDLNYAKYGWYKLVFRFI